MSDHDPLPAAPPGVLLVFDDAPRCYASTHAWPVAFKWDDPCRCGAFSLRRAADLTIRVEPTAREDDRR